MATINIRTEETVKQQAAQIFDDLGLDMSSAINIFLKKSIMERGIPFDVRLDVPNETTIKAIAEGDAMIKGGHKGYSDTKAMWSSLNV